MLEQILDILLDVSKDTLKLVPFLFISYLAIEYIEHHHSKKIEKMLSKSGKFGCIIGALLGIVPQCGFGSAAASLYSGRVITIGTLFAVFISTSDEAVPVLISSGINIAEILKLIAFKFIIACIIGTIIDLIVTKIINKKKNDDVAKAQEENQKNQDEHIHKICNHCDCEHGIIKSAIKHTLEVIIYIFIISFAFSLIIHFVGEDNLSKILLNGSVLQPFVTSLIALIPNCAASVFLTQLYIEGNISFGAIIAALCANSGVGMIVLFKNNKDIKENLSILGSIYVISVIVGIILQFAKI